MKPKHQRLVFVAVSLVFLCASVLLTLRAFRDNLVFFYSPADIAQQAIPPDRLIRIGGVVVSGSITRPAADTIRFTITDGTETLSITYTGLLPNLFRDGQGVVAEGYLKDTGHFEARSILAKHDENYMPREVVHALKRSGRWKGTP